MSFSDEDFESCDISFVASSLLSQKKGKKKTLSNCQAVRKKKKKNPECCLNYPPCAFSQVLFCEEPGEVVLIWAYKGLMGVLQDLNGIRKLICVNCDSKFPKARTPGIFKGATPRHTAGK